MRAGKAGDNGAAIDIPEHHHRHVGRRGKSHIGDVAGPQVDLRRAAGALDQDDINVARKVGETLQHRREQFAFFSDNLLLANFPSAYPAR